MYKAEFDVNFGYSTPKITAIILFKIIQFYILIIITV